ncbi:MAG: hypothetical protein ACLP8A_08845 [Methylovirgula sp.]
MAATYHSKVCEIAHQAMEQLFAAGLIDAPRMFEFDRLCRSDIVHTTRPAAQATPAQAPTEASAARR